MWAGLHVVVGLTQHRIRRLPLTPLRAGRKWRNRGRQTTTHRGRTRKTTQIRLCNEHGPGKSNNVN